MKPRLEHHAYDAVLKGVFGTFGAGGGLQIAYLQSTLDAPIVGRFAIFFSGTLTMNASRSLSYRGSKTSRR